MPVVTMIAGGGYGPFVWTDPFSGINPLSWYGPTWTVAAGSVSNAPSVGAELIIDGDMDTPASWTLGLNWYIAGGVAGRNPGFGSGSLEQTAGIVGQWVRTSTLHSNYLTGRFYFQYGDSLNIGKGVSATGTAVGMGRLTGTDCGILGGVTYRGDIDDVSFKPIAVPDLFYTLPATKANAIATVKLATNPTADFSQAGLVMNLDSVSAPANFVLAYVDGNSDVVNQVVRLVKCVGGVYTQIGIAAVVWGATKVLSLEKAGTAYIVKYDGVIETSGIVSDAAIISNKLHGLFSDGAVTFDDYTLNG